MAALRLTAGGCVVSALVATFAGCASISTIIPPVTPALSTASSGTPMATLEDGRRTYVTACTACHNADPVTKYSADEWREIVSRMGGRAKLDAARQSALLSYLVAARTTALAAAPR